jgi:hypothetical protein
MSVGWMNNHVRSFVDDDEITVFMEDGKGDRFRRNI